MKCTHKVLRRTPGRKNGRWYARQCKSNALKGGGTLCRVHHDQEQRQKRGE